MSKYAKINSENIVENIIVCEDSEIGSQNGLHIKVTADTNRAEIGYEYVEAKNKFKSPQPYESWVLNESTVKWECPVSKPEDAEISIFDTVTNYRWDEENQAWLTV